MSGNLAQSTLYKMFMFDVEVLEYLQGNCAVVFVCWNSAQDPLERPNDIGDNKLVFFSYKITVFLVLLPKQPTIHSRSY